MSAVYGSWLAALPNGKIPNKSRPQYFYTLFHNLKEAGYSQDVITPEFKAKILAYAVPSCKPASMESDRYISWRQQVESDYDIQLATVMHTATDLSLPDSLNPEFSDMTPNEIRHYKEFMAIPVQERPCLPYSVKEYSRQRDIADSFVAVEMPSKLEG